MILIIFNCNVICSNFVCAEIIKHRRIFQRNTTVENKQSPTDGHHVETVQLAPRRAQPQISGIVPDEHVGLQQQHQQRLQLQAQGTSGSDTHYWKCQQASTIATAELPGQSYVVSTEPPTYSEIMDQQ